MWTRRMSRAIEEASKYCRRNHSPHPLTLYDRRVLEELGVKRMDDRSSIYDVDVYCADGPCECRDEEGQCECSEPDEEGNDNEA